jgi:hypothetical protein
MDYQRRFRERQKAELARIASLPFREQVAEWRRRYRGEHKEVRMMRAARNATTPQPQPEAGQVLRCYRGLTIGDMRYARGMVVDAADVPAAAIAKLVRSGDLLWTPPSPEDAKRKPARIPPPEPSSYVPVSFDAVRGVVDRQAAGDALTRLRAAYKDLLALGETKERSRALLQQFGGSIYVDAQRLFVDRHHAPYRRIPVEGAIWGEGA